jgi:hypothetical protein
VDNRACESECLGLSSAPAIQLFRQAITCVQASCGETCFGREPCADLPSTPPGTATGTACGSRLRTPATFTDALYFCEDGRTVAKVVCREGCQSTRVAEGDRCAGTDPCASQPRDGDVCGARLTPPQDRSVLYTCRGQSLVGETSCASGICVDAPEQEDRCR